MDVRLADHDGLGGLFDEALDRIGALRSGPRVSTDGFYAESFMRAHTEYRSFDRFRADAPVELDPPLNHDSPGHRRRVNAFVRDVTDFETWEEMETRSAHEELVDQLLSNTA